MQEPVRSPLPPAGPSLPNLQAGFQGLPASGGLKQLHVTLTMSCPRFSGPTGVTLHPGPPQVEQAYLSASQGPRRVFLCRGLSHHSHPHQGAGSGGGCRGQVHHIGHVPLKGERDDANIWLGQVMDHLAVHIQKPSWHILYPQIEGTKAFRRFCLVTDHSLDITPANSTQRITSCSKIKLRLINPNSQGSGAEGN